MIVAPDGDCEPPGLGEGILAELGFTPRLVDGIPNMALLEIVILAVVQGVAEFLPISSSGHVVVIAALFDQLGQPLEDKISVNVVLHVGTLLAVLVFYWRRVLRLLGQDRRVIGLLVVGTLPAVVVGLPLRWHFHQALESPMLAGFMFLVTGALLLWGASIHSGSLDCRELQFRHALAIGAFQALAILPGVSRSGATIVAGLACGLKRHEAAAFSFLLAIPAIGGAGLLEAISLLDQQSCEIPARLLILGGVLSCLVGLVSLWWLVRWLAQGRLSYFAWWVFLLGPVVVAWRLWWS